MNGSSSICFGGGGGTGNGLAVGNSFVSGGSCCIEPIGSSCGGLIGP